LALTHEQKEVILRQYVGKLEKAPVIIWSNYRNMTVQQAADLRAALRAAGAEVIVVKNTLLRLALEQLERPTSSEMMTGPSMVTMVYGDVAATTRAVFDFARLNEAVFQVRGGIVGNQVVSVDQVRALTTLPSREVMLGRVIGGIQAPISSFVGTLAAMVRGVMNVLNARQQQLEQQQAG
jgi:large subunit ribosomal protein L10